ncbi:hypothetical protein B0H10DRAFT_2053489 [Mycena sp. CBHHK59/15]|nr:hypothetical protein B0H10DRAFT_2053489 [Mycena sp. CBHHK59/15]
MKQILLPTERPFVLQAFELILFPLAALFIRANFTAHISRLELHKEVVIDPSVPGPPTETESQTARSTPGIGKSRMRQPFAKFFIPGWFSNETRALGTRQASALGFVVFPCPPGRTF